MLIQNNQRKTVIKSSGKALNNYYVNVENLVNDPVNKYNRNKSAPVLRKLRRYF